MAQGANHCNIKKKPAKRYAMRVFKMVEAGGVEPRVIQPINC